MFQRIVFTVLAASLLVVSGASAREFRQLAQAKADAPGQLIVHGYQLAAVKIATDGRQLFFRGENPELRKAGLDVLPYRTVQFQSRVRDAITAVQLGTSPVVRKQAVRLSLLKQLWKLEQTTSSRIALHAELDLLTRPNADILDSVRIEDEATLWYWKGRPTPERGLKLPPDWVKPDPVRELQKQADELVRLLDEGYLVFISDGVEYRVSPQQREAMLVEINGLRAGLDTLTELPREVRSDLVKSRPVDQLRPREE